MKPRTISASLFTLTLGFGVLTPASPAHSVTSLVSVSDGQILDKGAAVTGTYTVSCQFFGESIHVHWTLRQKSGNTVAYSIFDDVFQCAGDGAPVTRTYNFQTFNKNFKPGPASITGFIRAEAGLGSYEQNAEEIALRR